MLLQHDNRNSGPVDVSPYPRLASDESMSIMFVPGKRHLNPSFGVHSQFILLSLLSSEIAHSVQHDPPPPLLNLFNRMSQLVRAPRRGGGSGSVVRGRGGSSIRARGADNSGGRGRGGNRIGVSARGISSVSPPSRAMRGRVRGDRGTRLRGRGGSRGGERSSGMSIREKEAAKQRLEQLAMGSSTALFRIAPTIAKSLLITDVVSDVFLIDFTDPKPEMSAWPSSIFYPH